ncbi:MAG: DedA family protein [Candidatus Limnocylindrales bacterium]
MDLLSEIIAWVTGLIDSLAEIVTDDPITYVVIFAMAAIDVIAPIVPAEATVTAAAVLAGQGKINIVWVMVAAGLGAFVGDNVAYWIGRAAGRPLVEKVLRGNTGQLDKVQEQFDKRGGVFIIIGRFVPGGRTAVAVGAGILHFKWLHFILYDALAATIWAFQAALPGFIGGSLIQDRPWLAMIFGFALSAIMAGGIALLQRWWDRRRQVEVEVPIKPAVLGIGGVDAQIEGPAETSGGDGGPAAPAADGDVADERSAAGGPPAATTEPD